jgi:hypothetical protein
MLDSDKISNSVDLKMPAYIDSRFALCSEISEQRAVF